MLLQGDIKSLEIVAAAYLSQDIILQDEVKQGKDFHSDNQRRFKLPDRVTAKRFVFKLIYGASAYGYANDGDFQTIGFSQRQWQGVIDEYYEKYKGIRQWHQNLVRSVLETGCYVSPTGRRYEYPSKDVASREWFWRPRILNYPVQGLGADLVMLARISMWRRIQRLGFYEVPPVSSVHDSIVLDVPSDKSLDMKKGLCYTIGKMLRKCVQDVPINFERQFGQPFDLPLDCEVKVGLNLGSMEKIEC